MTLDFGTPLLGVPVELTVTITNIGGGPLEILAVMLEEDGEHRDLRQRRGRSRGKLRRWQYRRG